MSDFTYMSLGGGVQSGTLAEMIAVGELPAPDVVLFADTHDEPEHVYRHIEYLGERLATVAVPLLVVSAGNLVERLTSGHGRFAAIPAFTVKGGKRGRLRRQCTREFKIAPIEHAVRRLLLESGLGKRSANGAIRVGSSVRVEAWLGISLDEVARMKPSRTNWIENRWPLIERRMTRHDCMLWLQRHGLPIPSKSSCRICPFHRDSYWRAMRDESPEDWQHVVDFDASLRDERAGRFAATATGQLYLHSSCIPLAEVDLRTPEERGQMHLFESAEDMCDEGYCFI